MRTPPAAHGTYTGGMTVSVVLEPQAGRERVGKVFTTVRISNYLDEADADRGLRSRAGIRELVLDSVLVDTGADTLCLPASAVAELGLPLHDEVTVLTATGASRVRVFRDANIRLAGRSATVQCFELPDGSPPLLGVIPLQILGLEPDLANHVLRVLPDQGLDTHYTA